MKFFRMSNGDIVTSIRPVTGTPGIHGMRVYDATNGCYCFDRRVYRGSLYNIQKMLDINAAKVLTNQLNKMLQGGQLAKEPEPHMFCAELRAAQEAFEGWFNKSKEMLQAARDAI